jgi:hypothetical protein
MSFGFLEAASDGDDPETVNTANWPVRQAQLSETPLFETAPPTAAGPCSRPERSGFLGGIWSFKNPKSTYERVRRGRTERVVFARFLPPTPTRTVSAMTRDALTISLIDSLLEDT